MCVCDVVVVVIVFVVVLVFEVAIGRRGVQQDEDE